MEEIEVFDLSCEAKPMLAILSTSLDVLIKGDFNSLFNLDDVIRLVCNDKSEGFFNFADNPDPDPDPIMLPLPWRILLVKVPALLPLDDVRDVPSIEFVISSFFFLVLSTVLLKNLVNLLSFLPNLDRVAVEDALCKDFGFSEL
ncbi:unnamed protein product [[Candida] boidinii]|uniref:Unnamed protein product n=1 Tax=Candida boidinii TaxID=5477 RepID=A0A9W6SW34_CANBO|nr:unnamed protein product [[Candida] boidinii]